MLPESSRTAAGKRSFRSIRRGIVIGAVIGGAWTAVFGPLTDGPPSIWLSLAVYTIGFAGTGAVVGAVGRFPELVGLSSGFLILAMLAAIVGPKDGWLVLWVIVFGGSGLLWGCIVGLLFRFFGPRENSESVAAVDDGP